MKRRGLIWIACCFLILFFIGAFIPQARAIIGEYCDVDSQCSRCEWCDTSQPTGLTAGTCNYITPGGVDNSGLTATQMCNKNAPTAGYFGICSSGVCQSCDNDAGGGDDAPDQNNPLCAVYTVSPPECSNKAGAPILDCDDTTKEINWCGGTYVDGPTQYTNPKTSNLGTWHCGDGLNNDCDTGADCQDDDAQGTTGTCSAYCGCEDKTGTLIAQGGSTACSNLPDYELTPPGGMTLSDYRTYLTGRATCSPQGIVPGQWAKTCQPNTCAAAGYSCVAASTGCSGTQVAATDKNCGLKSDGTTSTDVCCRAKSSCENGGYTCKSTCDPNTEVEAPTTSYSCDGYPGGGVCCKPKPTECTTLSGAKVSIGSACEEETKCGNTRTCKGQKRVKTCQEDGLCSTTWSTWTDDSSLVDCVGTTCVSAPCDGWGYGGMQCGAEWTCKKDSTGPSYCPYDISSTGNPTIDAILRTFAKSTSPDLTRCDNYDLGTCVKCSSGSKVAAPAQDILVGETTSPGEDCSNEKISDYRCAEGITDAAGPFHPDKKYQYIKEGKKCSDTEKETCVYNSPVIGIGVCDITNCGAKCTSSSFSFDPSCYVGQDPDNSNICYYARTCDTTSCACGRSSATKPTECNTVTKKKTLYTCNQATGWVAGAPYCSTDCGADSPLDCAAIGGEYIDTATNPCTCVIPTPITPPDYSTDCSGFVCPTTLTGGSNPTSIQVWEGQYGNNGDCSTTCNCPSDTTSIAFTYQVDTETNFDYLRIGGRDITGETSDTYPVTATTSMGLRFTSDSKNSWKDGGSTFRIWHGVQITNVLCNVPCNSNWQTTSCTEWTPTCTTNGQTQTRTCTDQDQNGCEDVRTRPETRTCSVRCDAQVLDPISNPRYGQCIGSNNCDTPPNNNLGGNYQECTNTQTCCICERGWVYSSEFGRCVPNVERFCDIDVIWPSFNPDPKPGDADPLFSWTCSNPPNAQGCLANPTNCIRSTDPPTKVNDQCCGYYARDNLYEYYTWKDIQTTTG